MLRTLCNQKGISCKDITGKYLPKEALIKMIGGDVGNFTERLVGYVETAMGKIDNGLPRLGRMLRQLGI